MPMGRDMLGAESIAFPVGGPVGVARYWQLALIGPKVFVQEQ